MYRAKSYPDKRRIYLKVALCFFGCFLLVQLFSQVRTSNNQSQTRAVVIGISEYQDSTIGNLRFAHKDAEAFAAYLNSDAGGALTSDQVKVLLNQEATHGQVVAALEWLQVETKTGDRAIIFFSGHGDAQTGGSRAGYLLCTDAVVRKYSMSGAMALSTLQEIITTLSVEKEATVLFFADACRSGGLQDQGGARIFGESLSKVYANELKVLSCQPHELSHEGPQWGEGHGVFTYYLLDGLIGMADVNGDAQVSLLELSTYLKQHVSQDMMPVQQVPLARGDETRIIARVNEEILDQVRHKKGRELMTILPAIPRSNKYERLFAHVDTSIVALYVAFKRSLEEKRLLTPEADCAEVYYSRLILEPSLAPIHADIKRDYVAHLQLDAQQALNHYLRLDVQQLSRSAHILKEQFSSYPAYLQRAAELLGPYDFRYSALTSRQHLFEGIIANYSSRSIKEREVVDPIIQSFKLSIEAESENPIATYFIMVIYASRFMDYDSASYFYHSTIAQDSAWIWPHAWWGYYLSRNFKRFEEASEVIEKALQLDAHHNFTLKAKASLLFYKKDYDAAILIFHEALKIDPNDHFSWSNVAACHQKLGQHEEAEVAYRKSLKLSPEQFLDYFKIGNLYYEIKDYAQAQEAYVIAVEKEPNYIPLRVQMAKLYLLTGQADALEVQCQILETLSSSDYRPWYFRACIAASEGKEDRALQMLTRCFQTSTFSLEDIECHELKAWMSEKPTFINLAKQYIESNH